MIKKNGRAALMLALFFIARGLFAADELSVTAGVCLLEYSGEREEALAGGVSARLFEIISGLNEIMIDPDQHAVLLTRKKELEVNEKIKSVEKLYAERDQVIFSNKPQSVPEKLAAVDEKIDEALDKLGILEEELSEIKYKQPDYKLMVPFRTKPGEDGSLLGFVSGPVSEIAADKELDYVVYGCVETIDEYEFIEFRIWDDLTGRDRLVWRTAVDAGNVNELIEPGLTAVKTEILGREWAEITVRGPDNSMIYVDGEFAGIGKLNRLLVDPGEVGVEIRKSGCESLTERITAEAFVHSVYEFELEELEIYSVVVQTLPHGADVYLDSVWSGVSPVRLKLQNETSAVAVKKEDYEEISFFVDNDTENIINLTLKPLSSGREQWVPDARKRFYTSFGSFLLSIPLTSLFSHFMDQTANAYQRENVAVNRNTAEMIRLYNLNRASYAMYLASTGLNVFLFLDTMINAVEYVGGVDYFSN